MTDVDALVARLYALAAGQARAGHDWQARLHASLSRELEHIDAHQCIEALRDHRQYGFAVAEAAGEVCAKPREALAYVLVKIVEELLDERGVTG